MHDPVFTYADPASSIVKRTVIHAVEAATGQRKLKRIYLQHRAESASEPSFWRSAVRRLDLDVQFDKAALERMPATGPVVVVANHPYGVLDGLVIAWLVEQVRSDFLVLTNAVLLRAPEVRDYVLPVDFAETPQALKTNLASRDAARRHLAGGGVVVVFPAGGVSTAPDRMGRAPAVDAPWQPFTAHLIQRSRATVMPFHFMGQNSRLFQIASHLSLTLRLSLIFREVKNRIGTVLPVAIGAPIPFSALESFRDRKALADHLMALTYGLAANSGLDEPAPRLAERVRRAVSRKLASRRARRSPSVQPRPR